MARKTVVELIDDIDGGKADQTVTFSLDGVTFETDLSDENAAKLREALGVWTSSARRTGRQRRSSAPRVRNSKTAEIRKWARENGHEVSERGRVSAAIEEAYDAAH